MTVLRDGLDQYFLKNAQQRRGEFQELSGKLTGALCCFDSRWARQISHKLLGAHAKIILTSAFARVGADLSVCPGSNSNRPPGQTLRSAPTLSANKLITQPMHRQNVLWQAWIGFEVLPQQTDVHVHGARGRRRVLAPDFVEQRLARKRGAALPDEITEQLVFLQRRHIGLHRGQGRFNLFMWFARLQAQTYPLLITGNAHCAKRLLYS